MKKGGLNNEYTKGISRFDKHNAAVLRWYEETASGYFTWGQTETWSASTWKDALALVAVKCTPIDRQRFVIAAHIVEYMQHLVAEAVEEVDDEDITVAIVRSMHQDATISETEQLANLVKRRLDGKERRSKRQKQ